MSNEDFDPDQIGPPRDNVVDYILAQQRAAMVNAMPQDDDDPEKAARAIELSNATGVHPALIQADQDNFEQQHKAALTASLLRNNKFLMNYAQNPVAAKVSGDDWGQMDTVSQATQKLHQGLLGAPSSVMGAAVKGFKDNLDLGSFGQDMPLDENTNRFLWSLVSGVRGLVVETPSRLFTAGLEGFKAGATELQKQFGAEPNAAERRAEELTGMIEAEMMGLTGRAGMAHAPGAEIPPEIASAAKKGAEAYVAAKPYLDAGIEPPIGVHPLVDQMHTEQAKLDLKNLDEAFKESQASATRERAPELFADFIRQHTDSRIGIDAEAVRKLYGDKLPEADDNLLGWVPGIQDQLALAEAHGGDVEVPLADWLAKADPEVAKELHDFIRVRPGGMTLEETKEAGKPVELEEPQEGQGPPPPVTPEETLRKSAGLEPIFGRGYGKDNLVPDEPGIIPVNATSYEGEPRLIKGTDETLSPYLNFPLKEGLKQINSEYTGDVPMVMQEFYKDRLSKIVGDVPVRIVKDADMDRYSDNVYGGKLRAWAFYNPSTDEIYMSDKIASGQAGHDKASWILIHEGAHALTFNAMRKNPELKAMVLSLRDAFKTYWKEEDPTLLEEPGHKYALQNADEFWSQSWSSEEMKHSLSMTPVSEELAKAIGMKSPEGKSIYDAFRRVVRIIIQKVFPGMDVPPTMVDALFHLQSKFEQAVTPERGKLLGPNELQAAMKPEDAERDLFTKANAIGMTKDQYSRYMDLISKRAAEDLAHQVEQGKAIERERQTKEWKDNFGRVREEVKASLRGRPDLAADKLLMDGDLFGQKVQRPRLRSVGLSPDVTGKLPDSWLARDGVDPDTLAGLFGYQSGDALVGALVRLHQERELEGLTPAAHFSKLVDAETEREMRKQYGNLEENILADAKDHVISQTQMDMLHEETLALGQQSGASLPMSKDDFKRGAKELFNDSPLGSHSTDKYLAAAGRAGAKAEQALLEGKPGDAFKAKQQQYISLLLANEAKKLEKERGSFERLAKQFSKREVASVPAEYTNWIHDILMRTGNMVRRSTQDLAEAIGRETHDTLEKFVTDKNTNSAIWEQDENAPSDFQVMPVAPFLFDQSYRTTLDKMTPTEFRAVNNSIKTLVKNGRDDGKIGKEGDKRDLKETLEKMTSQLSSLFEGKEKQYAFGHKEQGLGHALRTYWASLLQIESIFNRFDRGDPKGVFRKVVSQPIFEGSHELHTLETKYSRLYKALDFPDKGEMKKQVENPLFGDPLYDGEKRPLTKGNLLAILQNVGNPSQLDKLARGYQIKDKNSIMQWLFANTTKEDWDRAQKLGNIFEQAFEHSAQMYHSLSGVAPEKIDIRPIQTPFGEYPGWYHPIIYDPLRPGSSKKLMGQNPLEDGSYYHVATPSGYTKTRTGYAAPIQLSFDAIPFRLKSMLNDIAMRPSVTDAAKVFYDPKFQMTVTKFYSKEIKDLLLPYLKDIAGQKQYKDAAQSTAQRYLEYARQNVTAALIGLNPSTVMKHGPTAAMLSIKEVGASNFLRELTGLLSMSDDLGEKNWKFAMKGGTVDGAEWGGSEELQRRQRNWQETLSGAQADLFGENTLRNTVIKLGATPVAISDLLSAVPTWLASYKAQIRAGEAHGDAVQFADTAVRRAHGSSAVAARPRIMRGGALAQFATPFYTFFNEMFQRQYEMAWRAKDAIEGRSLEQERSGEYKAGMKEVPNLMKGLWAFVVFPALIEQLVSPVLTGQEPTAVKLGAWGMRTIMSSLPGFRDLAEAFIGGRDPTVGLYSTAAKMLTDSFKDISKGEVSFSKAHAGKTIKHTITAFGAVTGLTNAQEGRTGEFVYDYATGKQRPKDISELLKGLWHGQIKEQRR